MKIGLLTLRLHFNYGGILQAYALQTYLQRKGHDAWLINNNADRQSLGISLIIKYVFQRLLLKKTKSAKDIHEFEFICQNTTDFIRKNINPVTYTVENYDALKRLNLYDFDAYIVGSDQVWRKGFTKKRTTTFLDVFKSSISNRPMFLDFTTSTQVKRIAFAASFGVDEWEYDTTATKRMAGLAKKFNAISVREDSGVKLCKEFLGVEALHVIDPTLLLDVSDYMNLCEKESSPKSTGNMMVYLMDESRADIADSIASKKNLTPFSVNAKTKSAKAPLYDRIYPPVTNWIRGFYDAEFVVTDSFHGCVFSIIFNKPFIAIGHEIGGMARFHSLLKMFGLEKRLVTSKAEVTDELIHAPIDFEAVNNILKIKRQEAWHFLEKALNDTKN